MEDNVFGSIEDIDAALDKELGEVANKSSEEPIKEEQNENTDNGTANTTADETPKEDEVTPEKPQNEVDKAESKKDYAFANLRTENGNLKKERDEYKSDSDFLKSLASSYGYTDVNKFQEAIKLAQYQKEAQDKGYDVELYKKTMEQEARIAQLEKERNQEIMDRKVEKLKSAIDEAVTKYDITEDDIFARLDNVGMSVDEILSVNNPKLLLDGVLIDLIQKNAKQSQINELQNMKGLVEDKNESNGVEKTITIEDLLKKDIAKYKAENFYE